ncbi:CRE-CUTL-22 protein, partial [Aphelenchoides avenae]
WRCEDINYAVKVYECFVHDGGKRRYMLIDEEGCSKDQSIMPDLTYDANLAAAYTASKVFKFAETSKMYFNCLLYMCPKSDVACRQSMPPKCEARQKRSISIDERDTTIDPFNSSMTTQLELHAQLPVEQHATLAVTEPVNEGSGTDDDEEEEVPVTRPSKRQRQLQKVFEDEEHSYEALRNT